MLNLAILSTSLATAAYMVATFISINSSYIVNSGMESGAINAVIGLGVTSLLVAIKFYPRKKALVKVPVKTKPTTNEETVIADISA